MPIPAPRSKCFRLHLKSEAKTSTTLVKICVFMCFYGAFTINITIYHEFMASNEDQNCWMAPFFGPTKPHESFFALQLFNNLRSRRSQSNQRISKSHCRASSEMCLCQLASHVPRAIRRSGCLRVKNIEKY